ncbi:hypothetical protein GV792_04925 [Nocardia cyriacigeorgica]|uniref:hypothetical protein n=1 Tax=Nocardia cyriacigeorgica TaxID=135487 RepID=UPI0013B9E322|nr:hypothetical protein [Nocardia cyriacigeorgica]NEW49387.1 hypothetical protein [Nocardia cyriacigeorgica]
MAPAVPRYRDGSVVTERELDCIAKGFGFMSWLAMEQTMRAAEAKRDRQAADRARAAKAVA